MNTKSQRRWLDAISSAEERVTNMVAKGGRAIAIQADSADPEAIFAAVAKTVDLLGPLDTVVVNAGILRINTVEAVSLEELDMMLDINVRGVYLSIQAVVPHLKDGGRIITIGSNTAIRQEWLAHRCTNSLRRP